MKQTIEEAASEYMNIPPVKAAIKCGDIEDLESHIKVAFESGAEWQAKQSPWIRMKERLPEDTSEKLVMLVDGTIRIAHYDEDYNEDMEYHFWYDCAASESYHRDDVIYWMPIPSFDEILEANRDVLERIKEKGD
ncbi:hypothetical protein INE81_03367 [Bacteroides salyersiae]|uniref:DUF551 domain-containing protein n=1 Tax=Bacteroides salyersiae TaxID=291644 RepID=UPI001B8B6CBE|nr:DUF551 domain-containing protein [Bacteroides salyersiae]QUT76880.1 hypothetical protein INE81_03367 [Bacteroides salyersiae]